jgi:heme exporter protein B
MTAFMTLRWALARELQMVRRRPGEVLNLWGFFILTCSMFPLAIGPQREWLQRMGSGVIWVAALLATLLALPRLFADDHLDGSLEAMLASGHSLPAMVAGKLLATWLTTALPLIVISPVLATALALPASWLPVLLGALLLGTPILLGLGAIGAALTLGLPHAQTVLMLVCLPLFVPVLIFGAGSVEALAAGLSPWAHLALLGAGMLLAALAVPPLVAHALRIAME